MIIKSLAHACIKTRDLARTLTFYEGALGLHKLFNFVRGGEVIGFYLKTANDTFIEVFRMDDAEPGYGRQTLHHFCFETDAIDELRERLAQKGYAPGAVMMGADHSPQFWVKDPNGLDIEFQQYTDRSSQLIGADVEVTR